MGQVVDRTVVLGKRWTDGELLVLFSELVAIAFLQPVIGLIMGIVLFMVTAIYILEQLGQF